MALPQTNNVEVCASCGAEGHPVQELGDDLQLRPRCGQCGAVAAELVADGPLPAPVIPIRPDLAASPSAPKPVAITAGADILAAAETRLTAIDAALAEHDALKREAKQLRRMIAAYRRG